jgi:hypothetical protein
MNLDEAPTDDAEVLRLLKEFGPLGADSSLWLRPLRQLTREGKPLGRIHGLLAPVDHEHNLPFAMLTFTAKGRLVFWPALPRPTNMASGTEIEVPDHITVEFPSERLHLTAYDKDGRPVHRPNTWGSTEVQESKFRWLFAFLVRLEVVRQQDVLISRRFPTPPADRDRRSREFAKFAQDFLHLAPVEFPESPAGKDYIYCGVYAAPTDVRESDLPKTFIPQGSIGEIVDGWPPDVEFPMAIVPVPIELPSHEERVFVAVAFPPGKLKDDVSFGFPRRSPVCTGPIPPQR